MPEFIREFPYRWGTDRDCEVPVLMEFIQGTKQRAWPAESILDIGAHYTVATYAPLVRPKFCTDYDAIDIQDDLEVRKIVDEYIVGNALDCALEPHDVVLCVSTIEHAGISTYKVDDWEWEQDCLFERCLELAKRFAFISFEVGVGVFIPDCWAQVNSRRLARWERRLKPYKWTERFFWTQHVQLGLPWHEHGDREFAVTRGYDEKIGNQNICVIEVEK